MVIVSAMSATSSYPVVYDVLVGNRHVWEVRNPIPRIVEEECESVAGLEQVRVLDIEETALTGVSGGTCQRYRTIQPQSRSVAIYHCVRYAKISKQKKKGWKNWVRRGCKAGAFGGIVLAGVVTLVLPPMGIATLPLLGAATGASSTAAAAGGLATTAGLLGWGFGKESEANEWDFSNFEAGDELEKGELHREYGPCCDHGKPYERTIGEPYPCH